MRVRPGAYLPADSSVNAVARARCEHLAFGKLVIGGFAGLNYHGIPYWSEVFPVIVHSPNSIGFVSSDIIRLCRSKVAYEFGKDPVFPKLAVASPAVCVIDALIQLKQGRITWWVPPIEGFEPWEVRAVQLIDAARRKCKVSWNQLADASTQRFSKTSLLKLAKQSVSGADSPQETSLRLIAGDLAPNLQLQKAVYDTPRSEIPFTFIDLTWKGLKVAVYYDGEDHYNRERRNKDFAIRKKLEDRGWQVITVTAPELAFPEQLRRRIQKAVWKAQM
ncbi:hypothetical protein CKALI_03055 [Corynebacterium kalinowskii]|uniref:DUF559 domain-containing protein n=1 Tax=Corynebacterium kalinowskii TaxID=2675216 RepID=A0A6B8VJ44_9CORY|nr:hypothetical protein [Corynebacterium kalinowskii]QGU01494.1 hypothetical protein CKALI_03055 [Corynebacterium kalinowskii]